MRKMSIIPHDDGDERESIMGDEDDNKSLRSKKSASVYSSVAKSIVKRQTSTGQPDRNIRASAQGSQRSGSKRDSKTTGYKKEDFPIPTKLDLPQRQLHSDNLNEQHFTDLRNFLYKKQRQENMAAKMSKGRAGSIAGRPGQRMLLNEDIGSPAQRIDREIMAEIGGAGNTTQSPGSSKQAASRTGGP